MSEHDELRQAYAPLLHEPADDHGPECPSGEELLAAIRGEGEHAERLQVLDHALRCAACRRELALLHAVSGAGVAAQRVMAPQRSWRRWAPMAFAASVVIAVAIAGVDRWRGRAQDEVARSDAGGAPGLVAPSAGSELAVGPVTFVWHKVPRALWYALEVDATDGTVLFTTRSTDTLFAAPLTSAARGDNRWWVRAHLDDGSERHSETRRLTLR